MIKKERRATPAPAYPRERRGGIQLRAVEALALPLLYASVMAAVIILYVMTAIERDALEIELKAQRQKVTVNYCDLPLVRPIHPTKTLRSHP